MSDVRIEAVAYAYEPPRMALRDVSVNIPAGAFCGIIGPNGSGKTTLLKCVSGYLNPVSGHVTLDGRDVSSLSVREVARRMALVQQHAAIEYDFLCNGHRHDGPQSAYWAAAERDGGGLCYRQ